MNDSPIRVVGIDPGPTPGIVVLAFTDSGTMVTPNIFQCNAAAAPDLVDWAVTSTPHDWRLIVQVEKFVIGARSSRSSTPVAGQVTRDLIGELKRVTAGRCALVQQNASRVKGWASDERLDSAGLLSPTKGMPHARDGARHAIFCAVNSGGIPDPLSKLWNGAA